MKARLPQGYGKGPQDMSGMLKQAQKMQEEMTSLQTKLELEEYTSSVGGGAVEAVVNGKKELISLTIKPEVIDPEDVEMLQDLIISAVNEANRNAQTDSDEKMDKISGGLSIPGLI
ncbi:MAG: YbaB/EbfC family nucleoid-associated protein [Oscillospiraceae bacterium]